MNEATPAQRLARLRDEIGYALGVGDFPEGKISEFRWLWRTTPDMEKDGLSFSLQDLEAMVRDMRRERQIGKGIQRIPITHKRIGGDEYLGDC